MKASNNITVHTRQSEFSDDFQVLNDQLFFISCNKSVNWTNKVTVKKNLNGEKHKVFKLKNN